MLQQRRTLSSHAVWGRSQPPPAHHQRRDIENYLVLVLVLVLRDTATTLNEAQSTNCAAVM